MENKFVTCECGTEIELMWEKMEWHHEGRCHCCGLIVRDVTEKTIQEDLLGNVVGGKHGNVIFVDFGFDDFNDFLEDEIL